MIIDDKHILKHCIYVENMSVEVQVIILTDVGRLHHKSGADNSFRQKADDVHRVQRLKSMAIDVVTNWIS